MPRYWVFHKWHISGIWNEHQAAELADRYPECIYFECEVEIVGGTEVGS